MTLVHGSAVPTGATAWVVLGSSGQWSDWYQWAVAVYADEQAAKDFVGSVTAAIHAAIAEEPDAAYDDAGEHTQEYTAWLDRLAAIDDSANQYDQPHYTAVEVPFHAAILKATTEQGERG